MYNKMNYIEPVIDVTLFECEDIITSSNGLDKMTKAGDNIFDFSTLTDIFDL